jgi:acyl dehydratase
MCTPTQLEVGTELPPLTKAPDRAQLVKFAAGSGDFNPLHYDADFPQAYNSVTTSSTVGSRTRRWDRWCRIGSAMVGSCAESRLRTGAWIASAMPLPVMWRIVGLCEHGASRIVDLELWTENADGQHTTVGSAEVILAR